ncbi:MAG: LamG-like jellyroll fold domain-containing protein [Luteolibacter sp.]|uniref:LamG-like jellyroll fold domain-containing protein n=1 Tax=Luteolibacter sp. TaxID=1962973 RepID=UPI0032642CCE
MFDEDRLERLISAHFDRELTADERVELEAMLLSSTKARQVFLDHADFHGLLREQAMQAGGVEWLGKTAPPRRTSPRFPKGAWIAAGLAASIALGWWLLPKVGKSPTASNTTTPPAASVDTTPPANDEVALLGMAVDVEWNGRTFTTGEALPKGLLNIRKGTLRLDFYSGARVILEGPAQLELLSQNLARLDEGKLTAKVPPPAHGFTVLNGNLRVVDRGTQFGMSVTDADNCTVHVFDGEVELQGDVPEATARKLFEGEAVSIHAGKSSAIAADRRSFASPVGILQAAAKETEARWQQWRTRSQSLREAPGLLAYFDFEDFDSSSMTLPNRASGAHEDSNGSVIGCEKLTGRWDQKTALGFAKTSDRVRFRTEGSSPSITLMAWVRVDSLPLDHNSLLSMAPGEVGEVHWKLDRSGRLLFGLRAAPELRYDSWERLESPQVVTPNDFGRWMHLATVIDADKSEMRHYVNGKQVASGPLLRHTPIQFGTANLGNLDATWYRTQPVRNFNGRIDEFALFTRALTSEEIAAMQ